MSKVLIAVCLILIVCLSSFDKFAIDGVVLLIQANFNVNDAQTAIIRTSTSVAHTVTLFLVWIIGDVFNRRKLFLASVALWIFLSLLSVGLGSESFMIFVVFRCLAASAFAVFGLLTPVVLADLFRDRALGVALMLTAVSETVAGTSMNIISSWIISSSLSWKSALIAAPLIVSIPLLPLLCAKSFGIVGGPTARTVSVKGICSNAFRSLSTKSYLLLTASSALGTFHTHALMFWQPSMYLAAFESFPDGFFGLSYTMATTLNYVIMNVGLCLGLPTILWFAQSWYHGTGPFSGRKGYATAFPITVAFGAFLNISMLSLSIILFGKSYVGVLMSEFFEGVGYAAYFCLIQQLMLMVVASSSRSGAVALSKLIAGVVSVPAAQLIGIISDAVRGDSTLAIDRFHAYQVGLLCAGLFPLVSAFCLLALILVFPRDCEKAEQQNNEETEIIDEKTSLIENPKLRSESILESLIRSRTATVNSTARVV